MRPLSIRNARVVHQSSDRAEGFACGFDGGENAAGVGHVDWYGCTNAACRVDLGGERFEAIDPSTTDGDRCSRKSENLGEALAEA